MKLEANCRSLEGALSLRHKLWLSICCPGGSNQGMCPLVDIGLTWNKESWWHKHTLFPSTWACVISPLTLACWWGWDVTYFLLSCWQLFKEFSALSHRGEASPGLASPYHESPPPPPLSSPCHLLGPGTGKRRQSRTGPAVTANLQSLQVSLPVFWKNVLLARIQTEVSWPTANKWFQGPHEQQGIQHQIRQLLFQPL